jgi:hypothetical protein
MPSSRKRHTNNPTNAMLSTHGTREDALGLAEGIK